MAQIRADVALRMAHLDQISPEIIHKIAAVIGQKLPLHPHNMPLQAWLELGAPGAMLMMPTPALPMIAELYVS